MPLFAFAYYNEIDPYCVAWLKNLMKAGLIMAGEVDHRPIEEVKGEDTGGFVRCHWFAGIAGWELALQLAGWDEGREIWTGSCPCQPFSVAGKRKGTEDKRHLWPEFLRVIRESKPERIAGEQVDGQPGLQWLAGVCADLEESGYECGAAALPAAGVGAPHIRQRLWWVAERLAHGTDDGRLEVCQNGRGGTEGGRAEGRAAGSGLCGASGNGGLAHGVSAGLERGEVQSARQEREAAERGGGTGRLALTQHTERGAELQENGDAYGRNGSGGSRDAEPTGCWDPFSLVSCLDGKVRRVPPAQSGVQPLAAGLSPDMGSLRPGEDSPYRAIWKDGKPVGQAPWRVGMLRAYGNAICPPLAAEVLKAWLAVRP